MKTLYTERLILRKFAKDDLDAVQEYAGNPENVIFMLWGPNSEELTRAFIETAISAAEKTPCTYYQFAIILKSSNALIGACHISLTADAGELGWILHRDYWKQGLGTEMGEELLRFAFEELGLRRVLGHCDADNTGSFRLMEKIGMRREGLFIEARPAHKQSSRRYSDELSYAILKDDWDARKEIAYYNALPFYFNGFIELPDLADGEIRLVCVNKVDADPEKNWVPVYKFAICIGSERIGGIDLRIGYTESLYYGGQIGYNVNEPRRGNGYAGRACRLLAPVAKAHGMTKLLITNNYTNTASRRVCEKLGARFVRLVRIPEWHDLYKAGQRYENIFEWDVV